MDGPVTRVISDATTPGTQPARCSSYPAKHVAFGKTGASIRIACAGVSERTVAPSYRGRWGKACMGTSVRWRTTHPQNPHIYGRRYRHTALTGGARKGRRRGAMIRRRGGTSGRPGRRKGRGTTQTRVWETAWAPLARPLPVMTSIQWGAQTERQGRRRTAGNVNE